MYFSTSNGLHFSVLQIYIIYIIETKKNVDEWDFVSKCKIQGRYEGDTRARSLNLPNLSRLHQ